MAAEAFAAVISLLPDAILLVSSGGEIQSANSRAAEMLQLPPADLSGRALAGLVAEDPETVAALLRTASRSGVPVPGSLTLKAAERRPIPCRCEGAVLQARSGEAPALLLLRLVPKESAVNRFVALNMRIDELGREIGRRQRAEVALAEADRRKDEFLAMLAHELRNPLAVLGNGIQYIRIAHAKRAPGDDPALAELGDSMQRQLRQLARLVEDLLDVSRITTGKIVVRKALVRLETVLQNAIETCRPAIVGRDIDLAVTSAGSLMVEADSARLSQVFCNLLSNAVKFSEPRARVRFSSAEEGGQAVVRVSDSGTGIPAAILPRVFDLFMQADNSLARSQGGLGVGLTIAKLIAELHGGSIEARSEGHGRGSEFIVRLPLAPVRGDGLARGAHAASDSQGARRKILVVDDNQDAAESLAFLLRLSGHEVRIAHSGEAALRLRDDQPPEVVLLDLGMPGMDGYETARRLRQSARASDTLIVAVTGYGADADRRQARAAGFDHLLTKPVEIEVLEKLMSQ
jgi:signal transduction histidine kinase